MCISGGKKSNNFLKLLFFFIGIGFPFLHLCAQHTNAERITAVEVQVKEVRHSPGRATLYSTLLPGLGQVYNKQYWKIPVIYGGAGVVLYFAKSNYTQAKKFKTEYINRDQGNTEALDPEYKDYPAERIYSLYSSYQKDYELMLVFTGLIYLLNVADAYVFAHLFSYDLSDDLSLKISPQIDYHPQGAFSNLNAGLKLSFSF